MQQQDYIGRYAPSPTGDLHLGNLRTAMLAWLHAELSGGQLLLRMEDLDSPRVVAGAADQILRDLDALGISWHGPVVYQSERTDRYKSAMNLLDKKGLIYPCFCSRKELQQIASAPHGSAAPYPGTCAHLDGAAIIQKAKQKVPSYRLRVDKQPIKYIECIHGDAEELLAESVGDFVLKRADGLFAYQLAVVVDDLEQGVTDVIRGADLLQSTARQRYLAMLIKPEGEAIRYWHVPLMNDASGARMAKRDGSCSLTHWLDTGRSVPELIAQFAQDLGLLPSAEPISLVGLKQELSLQRLELALRTVT